MVALKHDQNMKVYRYLIRRAGLTTAASL